MSCGEIFIARRPKPCRSGSEGCAPIGDAVVDREAHGLADGGRIAAVEAAGDVGRGDERHDLGVGAHLPGAVALAHVAVQVDRSSRRFMPYSHAMRAQRRVAAALARAGAARSPSPGCSARSAPLPPGGSCARRGCRRRRSRRCADSRRWSGGRPSARSARRSAAPAPCRGRSGPDSISSVCGRASSAPARRKPMRFDSGATRPHGVEEERAAPRRRSWPSCWPVDGVHQDRLAVGQRERRRRPAHRAVARVLQRLEALREAPAPSRKRQHVAVRAARGP